MIDIHSHIIPNIDDGSKSIEESLHIISYASKCGVSDIVCTPHFILGSVYNADNSKKQKLFDELKTEVKKLNIPVNLYLGNEVFVENDMLSLLTDKKITTINDSKYLLFELPMNNEFNGIRELIFNLQVNGYIPILAHPERYTHFHTNPQIIMDLKEQGVLFQCNVGSFYGHYGKSCKDMFIMLLKHHMINFISSDTHYDAHKFYEQMQLLKTDLKKYISDDEIEELLNKNAQCVLENQKLQPRESTKIEKTIFGHWK